MSPAAKKSPAARASAICGLLAEEYPKAECALVHDGPFQLLCATILSAQCTDARVNMVTPALFERFPDPASMADAPDGELEDLIRSTGFFNNKAKSLRGAGAGIRDRFHGQVPDTMADLITLPGVARKTAGVVLGVTWGKAEGVVVDTHVKRIAHLLGLTKQTDPNKVERDLMEILPDSEWIAFSHRLILHGRAVCVARRPKCAECVLNALCPSAH